MAKKQNTKIGTETSYKKFLNQIDLYALGLDSISADIKREPYAAAHADESSEIVREIKSHFKLIEFGEGYFDVSASFTLRIKIRDEEDLLFIRASFTAHFHSRDLPQIEEHANRFAQSEARLIFWPYFRQLVADTTARMHIRPITIPISLKP